MGELPITEERLKKFKQVVAKRQYDLTVVLENIHDPHNIGAVLRSCDSVGISEVFVILTDPAIDPKKYKIGSSSSSGAVKWVNIHLYTKLEEGVKAVRAKYNTILGTHLGAESEGLYSLDLNQSVALMFGNEHEGLTREALNMIDGNFVIPQVGLIQSLNISVACAVSLYEACRQRKKNGRYDLDFNALPEHQVELDRMLAIHNKAYLKGRGK